MSRPMTTRISILTKAPTHHPENGARFVLVRTKVGEDKTSAEYTASVFTPDNEYRYAAQLAEGGCELTSVGTSAPKNLERKLLTMAKLVARDAEWPRQIVRWRDVHASRAGT